MVKCVLKLWQVMGGCTVVNIFISINKFEGTGTYSDSVLAKGGIVLASECFRFDALRKSLISELFRVKDRELRLSIISFF